MRLRTAAPSSEHLLRLPRVPRWPCWLCLALCFWAVCSWAQDNTGALQGTGSDDTDAVLPGVTVTLTNQAHNRVLSPTAGSYGNSSFRQVDPGRYSIVFVLAGFSRAVYPGIDILSAQTLRL